MSKLQAEGGTLMCWADPFYPDRVIPQKVLERSVEVIQQGVACHYTPPIGNADLKEVIAKKNRAGQPHQSKPPAEHHHQSRL